MHNLVCITNKQDTLMSCGLNRISTIPSELKVFNNKHEHIATYRPKTIYLDNIKHTPKISIYEPLVLFVPTLKDCLDKCD